MDNFYGWVGVSGGDWRYILSGWGWVDIFYGWVGVGGGTFWVDGGVWTYLSVGGDGWG